MTAPPKDGEHVLVLAAKERGTTAWWVIRRAVARRASAYCTMAMAQPLGLDIRVLTPADEGITWCRGWSRESRDALAAAWKLYQSST